MGDELPAAIGTFQATFSSGPKCSGGLLASATPVPPGPRNCGHAGSPAVANEATVRSEARSGQTWRERADMISGLYIAPLPESSGAAYAMLVERVFARYGSAVRFLFLNQY